MTDHSGQILDSLIGRAKSEYVPPAVFVPIYGERGELDRAFEWLEEAFDTRSRSMVWINVSPGFDELRGDPRYHDIVTRMGFPEPDGAAALLH
jgi:hypothetical protein